jgi:hypothetical protein
LVFCGLVRVELSRSELEPRLVRPTSAGQIAFTPRGS